MIRNTRRHLGASDQTGCLSWPWCVAGGLGCPQPDSIGATLNPCCHFAPPAGVCPDDIPPAANSDGSYGVVNAAIDTFPALPFTNPLSSIQPLVYVGAAVFAAWLVLNLGGRH